MARIPSGMRKKENGLFEKRFTVEGKRYSAYGRSTKKCVENELRIREEIKAGLYNSNKNITLDAYFDEWEKSRRGTIKDSSIKINRSKYNNHIRPVLGKIKVQKIEKRAVVKLQQDLSKKLSASMSNGAKAIASSTVSSAIDNVLKRLRQQGIEIERFTHHAFRDTFATRYVEEGGNMQTLQKILGHSSLAMTADLYAHVLPNTKQQEMQQIENGFIGVAVL